SIGEIVSSLDPFCFITKDLKRDAQLFLQFYLMNMSERAYGIKENALFCPVREVSFAIAQTSPLTVDWMILTAETWLDTLRGNQASLSTIRRKSLVYKSLQKALMGISKPSDAMLNGIIMAVIAESRISAPGIAAVHLRGYEEVIRARGSLRKMILSSSSPFPYTSHVMPYLLCEPLFADQVYGDDTTGVIWGTLQLLIMEKNPIEPADLFYSIFPDSYSPIFPLENFELTPGICLYLTSGLFGPYLRSTLRGYNRYSEKTSHFAVLFIITSTLWILKDDSVLLPIFFDRFHILFHGTSFSNTAGVNSLTMEGFM
ncbi:hypothetical protein F5884DRAFT_686943, partial [Xylogone sp. PMI_703]